MVVKPGGEQLRTEAWTLRRLAWWAVMAASVFWTGLYLAAAQGDSLPGFTYVNF